LNHAESYLNRRHPISRWYLLPCADRLSAALSTTAICPWHVTLLGFGIACGAGGAVILNFFELAAVLILAAWFCDRLDGKLARDQRKATRWGAWLDANLDEAADLGLHAALAFAAATAAGSFWAWGLFAAFAAGKYLLLHGVVSEPASGTPSRESDLDAPQGWMRQLYHLPGNVDVRTHVLILFLVTGNIMAELAFVAVYFNLRWIARYFLTFKRLSLPNPEP
jgi:hypothetical protein